VEEQVHCSVTSLAMLLSEVLLFFMESFWRILEERINFFFFFKFSGHTGEGNRKSYSYHTFL